MIAGEMGRSLFKHPVSYMKLITKYRCACLLGSAVFYVGSSASQQMGSAVLMPLPIHRACLVCCLVW
jgi:hypothetical protein